MERKVTRFFIFIIYIFFSYAVMAKGESYNPDEVGLDAALKEGCESCHKGIEEVNKKMVEQNVNCVICHFGNPIGTTKSEAHNGMIRKEPLPDPVERSFQYHLPAVQLLYSLL